MKRTFCKFLLAAIVVNGFAALAWADALDNWSANIISVPNPLEVHGSVLLGLAYGSDRFVAAGECILSDQGFSEISNDGQNWSLGAYGDPVLDLYDVAYGNGVFVAVGYDAYTGNNIHSSTNGINWTSHATQISHFYRVIYANVSSFPSPTPMFVAVGDGILAYTGGTTNRQIYTSPDGITWTPQNSRAPSSAVHRMIDVAYSGSLFVAIDDSTNSYTSSDGAFWIRRANTTTNFVSINFCNDRFIAGVSDHPGMALNGDSSWSGLVTTNVISFDGTSWSGMVKDVPNMFSRVIFSNGLYAALSGTSIFTSTNATNWVQRNFQVPTNTYLTALAFGKSNLVIVGYQVFTTNNSYGDHFYTYSNAMFVSGTFLAHNLSTGFPPQIKIDGLVGRTYQIDCSTNLQSTNWQTIATFSLTNSPHIWTDANATNSRRYYRTALMP